jgi:hypothetical protein
MSSSCIDNIFPNSEKDGRNIASVWDPGLSDHYFQKTECSKDTFRREKQNFVKRTFKKQQID